VVFVEVHCPASLRPFWQEPFFSVTFQGGKVVAAVSCRREGPRGQYGRWHRFVVVVVVVVVVTLWLGLGSFTGALRKESHPEEKDHLKVRRFFWESLRRFVSITMFDDFLKEFLLKTVVEDRGTLSKEVWMRNFRVTKF